MALLKSWVVSANRPDGDFPLNNLPCGVFSHGTGDPRCGMAIGDFVLDVAGLEAEGLLSLGGPYLEAPYWNDVMEGGPALWADLRAQVTALLRDGASKRFLVEDHLIPLTAVTLHLPFVVAEFTDFFAGRHHADRVGPLPPNWLHMPLAYNGRASSVVVSGTPVRRPWGQIKGKGFDTPTLYEAAAIEGASKWQMFRYITWPGLKNTAVLVFIVITMQAFGLFARINVMTKGGPMDSTQTIVFQAIERG